MSDAHKTRLPMSEGTKIKLRRKVFNITMNKEFISMSEASNYYNIPVQNICSVCKGKRKTAGKYEWRYS